MILDFLCDICQNMLLDKCWKNADKIACGGALKNVSFRRQSVLPKLYIKLKLPPGPEDLQLSGNVGCCSSLWRGRWNIFSIYFIYLVGKKRGQPHTFFQ